MRHDNKKQHVHIVVVFDSKGTRVDRVYSNRKHAIARGAKLVEKLGIQPDQIGYIKKGVERQPRGVSK